jgi:multicomponent Na+:H+ antiporter subunit C
VSGALLFATGGALLFALGAWGAIAHAHLIRKVIAINVAGSGTFLVMVGLAQRGGVADPVPQALVLTGIVVAVAATACALALARRLHAATGRCELPGEPEAPPPPPPPVPPPPPPPPTGRRGEHTSP